MSPGEEREALLRVAGRLRATLGRDADPEGSEPGPKPACSDAPGPGLLVRPEDERLVNALRSALAQIAAAAGADGTDGTGARGVQTALEGAELVMRGTLIAGNAGQVASLLPSFVYLVTLPIVDQDEAIALSRRTSALVATEFPG